MRLGRVRSALVGGGLAAAGGAGFAGALHGGDLVLPLAVAASAGGAASLLSPDDRAGVRAAGALLLVVVLGTVPGLGATPAVLGELGDGVRLIRATLGPAPGDPELLAVPYVATAVAAFLGARSTLRWGPRYGLRFLPSLVVMGLGVAMGDEVRTASVLVPVAWIVVALLATVSDAGRRLSWRAAAAGAVAVAAVAAVAVPAGERLPGAERDPKVLPVGQAVPMPPLENPLTTVAELQRGPDEPMFTAETSAPVPHWRLAVLTEYDGITWTPVDDLDPVSRDVPRPDPAPSGTTREVAQSIELALPGSAAGAGAGDAGSGSGGSPGEPAWGPWLPVADRVAEISEDGLLFSPGEGVLLAPREVPPSYDASSLVGTPDAEALSTAAPARDEAGAGALALPAEPPGGPGGTGIVEELERLAGEITAGATSANARAVAIQEHLLQGPNLLDPQRSGQTLRQVHTFLFSEGGALGSTEQFVTSYVLLARAAGLPARVVVGFDGSAAPGRQTVTAHDAAAWAEVRFEDVGWVRFDPVPDPTGEVAPPEPPEAAGAPEDEAPPPEPPSPDDRAGSAPDEAADPGGGAGDDFAVPLQGLLVAAALLLALVLLVPPGVRAWRRRRRARGPGPRAQVAGAWATVVEEARRAGVPATPSLAVADVVRAGSRQLPAATEQLATLGRLANRASFAAEPPGPADAARAWELCREWVAARRSTRTLRRRLRDHFAL